MTSTHNSHMSVEFLTKEMRSAIKKYKLTPLFKRLMTESSYLYLQFQQENIDKGFFPVNLPAPTVILGKMWLMQKKHLIRKACLCRKINWLKRSAKIQLAPNHWMYRLISDLLKKTKNYNLNTLSEENFLMLLTEAEKQYEKCYELLNILIESLQRRN